MALFLLRTITMPTCHGDGTIEANLNGLQDIVCKYGSISVIPLGIRAGSKYATMLIL